MTTVFAVVIWAGTWHRHLSNGHILISTDRYNLLFCLPSFSGFLLIICRSFFRRAIWLSLSESADCYWIGRLQATDRFPAWKRRWQWTYRLVWHHQMRSCQQKYETSKIYSWFMLSAIWVVVSYFIIKPHMYIDCLYIYIYTHTHTYIYIYIYVCVCVCVCVHIYIYIYIFKIEDWRINKKKIWRCSMLL